MKSPRFTLIELVVSVIVISIIASIVTVKILDMKNKSIGAAVANNTKIIQTAADRYALDNNGEYPIKNDLSVNLINPQIIDVESLRKDGYLKKELDTSKVKEQYYWLDVFGVAWGSTQHTIEDMTSITGGDGKTRLEFVLPAGSTQYKVYEVSGYNKSGQINKKERHYKPVSIVNVGKKRQKVHFEIPDSSKVYLISVVDKYDQETAPIAAFYKGLSAFKPIISGEGKYEFKMESFDEMFWLEFLTIDDRPGNSTITYRFKVKNEVGDYGEWTNDFNSLPSSKAITVEVEMKGDADGNKPSLYDLRIMYRYAFEEDLPRPVVELGNPREHSKICPAGGTISTLYNGKWTDGQPKIVNYKLKLSQGTKIDTIRNLIPQGYRIVNVQYEYANEQGQYIEATGLFDIPAGSCVNVVYELEVESNGAAIGNPDEAVAGGGVFEIGETIPPEIITCKDNCMPVCTDCVPVCLEDCTPECKKNCEEPEDYCKVNECIQPPTCIEGDVGCVPPACQVNCSDGPPTAPNPQDAVVNDPDWYTLDALRFFAHGPQGMATRWYGMKKDDTYEEGKTRIVYRFAKSNGNYWSGEIDEIGKVGQSQSLMVVAYLQVHKDVKENPNQLPPKVNSIELLHEKGSFHLDGITPTLVILPVKDNNAGRDIFSDASNFDWQYVASDPRGREITEVEWRNNHKQYAVGKHLIEARVMNEIGLWSKWTEYELTIMPEKPVAKISKDIVNIYLNKPVNWSAAQSYDPDGDIITKIEWRGDKKSSYDKEGNYSVELRVQDSEGNWSEWEKENFLVTREGAVVYRIEAEDSKNVHLSTPKTTSVVSDGTFSGGQYVSLAGDKSNSGTSTFSFNGTGFDLKLKDPKNVQIRLTSLGEPQKILGINLTREGEYTNSIRNLPDKKHNLEIVVMEGSVAIDYIDIYSGDDTPVISKVYSKALDRNNIEGSIETNKIIPRLSQKLQLSYTLYKNAYTSAWVSNNKGENIRSLQVDKFLQGGTINQHSIIWDGKNNHGETVSTGDYNIHLTALGVERVGKAEFTYNVYVDNEKPVLRIEAEDSNAKRVVASKLSTIVNGDYSNGAVRKLQGNNSSTVDMNLYFAGTGFDLKVEDASELSIELIKDKTTKSTLGKISQSGESIFSVRDLEFGQYSLIIRSATKTTSMANVDYLDVYSNNDEPTITKVFANPLYSNGVESNIPSDQLLPHIGQQSKLYYTLDKDSYVSISVLNQKNELIRSLQSSKFLQGGTIDTHSIVWNGKDSQGNFVPDGKYTVKIIAEGIRKEGKVEQTFSLFVDNEMPTGRVEAESVIKPYVSLGVVRLDQSYSGGKYMHLPSGGTMTFKFSGTGFDIKMVDSLNATVSITNKSGTKVLSNGAVTVNGEFYYSIRGLSNDTHSVEVRVGSQKYVNVDYLDFYQ